MIGVTLAGGVIAFLTFKKGAPFLHNAVFRLAPAALILLSPAFFALIRASDNYSTGFRLLLIGLGAGALILGARGAVSVFSNRLG